MADRQMVVGAGRARGMGVTTEAGPWFSTIDADRRRRGGKALTVEVPGRFAGRQPRGQTAAGAAALRRAAMDEETGIADNQPRSAGTALVPDQNHQAAQATSAELRGEMAASSLDYDRDRKGSLYACSGIRDYWIVNLVDNQVEVYRDPVPDPLASHGWRYSTCTVLHAGDSATPLALPHTAIAVADLLP